MDMVRAGGAELAAIYCCPHAPDSGCSCRKPEPGLILQAARDLDFDPSSAIVIGDKASDIQLGRRVGAQSIWLASDAASAPIDPAAEFTARDLCEAAQIIERLQNGSR